MNSSSGDFRSMLTPAVTLLCAIVLVFVSFRIWGDQQSSSSQPIQTTASDPGPQPTSSQTFAPTPLPGVVASPLAMAENRLVQNMEFFDSRFERFTAELNLAEEKALSRSDLVGTRYQLKALQEQLTQLDGLATQWSELTTEWRTAEIGQRVAVDDDLLQAFVDISDKDRLSKRDVDELTERLAPLSGFIAMLEEQDRVPYEPGERFKSRLSSMVGNVDQAVRDFEVSLAELRRIERAARNIPAGEEKLQDAVHRVRKSRDKGQSGHQASAVSDPPEDKIVATSGFRNERRIDTTTEVTDVVGLPVMSPDMTTKPEDKPRLTLVKSDSGRATYYLPPRRPEDDRHPNDPWAGLVPTSHSVIRPDRDGNYLKRSQGTSTNVTTLNCWRHGCTCGRCWFRQRTYR